MKSEKITSELERAGDKEGRKSTYTLLLVARQLLLSSLSRSRHYPGRAQIGLKDFRAEPDNQDRAAVPRRVTAHFRSRGFFTSPYPVPLSSHTTSPVRKKPREGLKMASARSGGGIVNQTKNLEKTSAVCYPEKKLDRRINDARPGFFPRCRPVVRVIRSGAPRLPARDISKLLVGVLKLGSAVAY